MKDSQYQVPVLNLSTENINTAPLRYELHHSFTDKNKYVKRNVATEFEILARFLDFRPSRYPQRKIILQ